MRRYVRAAPLLLLSLVIGCAGAGDVSPTDALPANCDDPPQLTYANFGSAFLTKYCNGCHDFTQGAAQAESVTIIDVAVTSTYMPIGTPQPSSAERTELGTWLACGAP